MKKVVIYARVSTNEQRNTGFSIEEQVRRLKDFANRMDYEIIRVLEEDESAKNFAKRPVISDFFNEVKLKRIKPEMFICVRMDRFSRNFQETIDIIQWFKKNKIELKFLDTFGHDPNVPESLLPYLIEMVLPQIDNDRRSLNTIRGMAEARKHGRWMGTPPRGYSFVRENNISVLKENDSAKYIREAFSLISTGAYNINEARKILYLKGFKLSKSQFYNILTNIAYIGKIRIPKTENEIEQVVDGIHDAIIPSELFEEVQDIISSRKKVIKPKSKLNPRLILRGFLKCPNCGSHVTGGGSTNKVKNKYFYYTCQTCKKYNVPAEEVNKQFILFLNKFKIKQEVLELYYSIFQSKYNELFGEKKQSKEVIKEKINKVEERICSIMAKYADGELEKEEYSNLKESFEKQKLQYEKEIENLLSMDNTILEKVKYGFSLLKELPKYFTEATIETKHKILCSIFGEKLIFSENNYRTPTINKVLTLLTSNIGQFGEVGKEKAAKNSGLSYKAPPLGLEPRTP